MVEQGTAVVTPHRWPGSGPTLGRRSLHHVQVRGVWFSEALARSCDRWDRRVGAVPRAGHTNLGRPRSRACPTSMGQWSTSRRRWSSRQSPPAVAGWCAAIADERSPSSPTPTTRFMVADDIDRSLASHRSGPARTDRLMFGRHASAPSATARRRRRRRSPRSNRHEFHSRSEPIPTRRFARCWSTSPRTQQPTGRRCGCRSAASWRVATTSGDRGVRPAADRVPRGRVRPVLYLYARKAEA
jgi:hypothetical protein